MVLVPVWLLGTLILLLGYGAQGAALERGKLVVVQPLLVTTIVWALPLGYWLTSQQVVRRQVLGAGIVVVGLAMFVLVGDPDAGVASASTQGLLLASLVILAVVALLLAVGSRARFSCVAGCGSGLLRRTPLRVVGHVRQAGHQRPARRDSRGGC